VVTKHYQTYKLKGGGGTGQVGQNPHLVFKFGISED